MKLYKHQEDLLEMSKKLDNIALLWDLGTGKTRGVIEILRDKCNSERRVLKTLILGPTSVIYNWRKEILQATKINDRDIAVLNAKERKKEHNELIRITNYEALINKNFLNEMVDFAPEVLVCDESHLLKSPTAKRSKAVELISKSARFKYILTGTPIAKTVMDLFQQFLILDGGKTFGRNFFVFRNTYFVDTNSRWAGKQGYFPNFVPIPALYPSLLEKMHAISTRVDKKTCLDLPDRIEVDRFIQLSDEQAKIYKSLKNEFVAFVEECYENGQQKAVVAQLAITKTIRIRQLLSGFLILDDNSVKYFDKNPRLDDLEELIDQLPEGEKCIIWCVFKEEYKMIGGLLDKLSKKYVLLTGEITSEQKQMNIDEFNTNKEVQFMIANRKAGGTGVNLQAAAYSVNYSKTYSLIEELQSKDRNYRGGSEIHEKIINYTITTEGTLDVLVAQAIKDKKSISDMVLEWGKSYE